MNDTTENTKEIQLEERERERKRNNMDQTFVRSRSQHFIVYRFERNDHRSKTQQISSQYVLICLFNVRTSRNIPQRRTNMVRIRSAQNSVFVRFHSTS